MEVLAKGKYIRISPKKARPIANLIRGKKVNEARIMLDSLPQSSAFEIKKVLNSATANAENNFNLEKSSLLVAKITINGGPTIKRYMPRAKGMASEIKRRTSHIEIILSGEIGTKKKKTEKAIKNEDDPEKELKAEKVVGRNERDIDKLKEINRGNQGKKTQIFRRKTG